MDNDQLLNAIQQLLEGSETRVLESATRLEAKRDNSVHALRANMNIRFDETRQQIADLRSALQTNSKALTTNLEALIQLMQREETTEQRLASLTARVEDLERRRMA